MINEGDIGWSIIVFSTFVYVKYIRNRPLYYYCVHVKYIEAVITNFYHIYFSKPLRLLGDLMLMQ